jgi:hypothetical protein
MSSPATMSEERRTGQRPGESVPELVRYTGGDVARYLDVLVGDDDVGGPSR